MLLTIDIGNTYITFGCIEKKKAVFLERVSTNLLKTDLEYAVDLLSALQLHGLESADVKDGILACVVPALQDILSTAVERVFRFRPMIVRAAAQNSLSIDIDDPRQLGANLVINAVAALREYGAPVLLIDMGTATSIGVVDEKGVFIGSAILPGLQSSLDALTGGTAQLPSLSLSSPVSVYGRNTETAMNGGAVYGNAGMIDGILSRMIEELREKSGDPDLQPVITATGKLSRILAPYLTHPVLVNEALPLLGMAYLYEESGRAEG